MIKSANPCVCANISNCLSLDWSVLFLMNLISFISITAN